MTPVVWVNHRAFRLQWCQKCCFHRPPRTYHCPWCNICVEVSASLDLPTCPHPCPLTRGPVASVKQLPAPLKAKSGSNSQPLLVTHTGHYLCTCPGRLALACAGVGTHRGIHTYAGPGQVRGRKTLLSYPRLADTSYPSPSGWL